MAFCGNCGTQVADGVKFCPTCGTAMQAAPAREQQREVMNPVTPPPAETGGMQPRERTDQEKLAQATSTVDAMAKKLGDTADETAQYDPKDIEANKVMALLAYLGILVIVPLFAAKDSKYARFHSNQGLVLCIAAIVYGVVYSILSGIILAISWRLAFVVSLIGLVGVVFAVLCIIGIINALNGRAKELPIIGKYRLLK